MGSPIYPCIWCDGNASEMANYYTKIFKNASILTENPMVVMLRIDEQQFMFLNGGPMFKVNPSISFMVLINNEDELEHCWNELKNNSKVLMELNSYPWSEKYGWIEDQYGVSWQLILDKTEGITQRFVPSLMYTGKQNGRAQEAIDLYTSIFPNSGIDKIQKYTAGMGETEGNILHAHFHIYGYTLMCMDSGAPHQFSFNEGVSLVVECENQDEVNKYWNALSANGGEESMCGWLKDPFTVSWQIVPKRLSQLLAKGNAQRSANMMQALMKMKKLDIAALEEAYNQ